MTACIRTTVIQHSTVIVLPRELMATSEAGTLFPLLLPTPEWWQFSSSLWTCLPLAFPTVLSFHFFQLLFLLHSYLPKRGYIGAIFVTLQYRLSQLSWFWGKTTPTYVNWLTLVSEPIFISFQLWSCDTKQVKIYLRNHLESLCSEGTSILAGIQCLNACYTVASNFSVV